MAFSVKKRTNTRLNEIEKIQQPVEYVPNCYGDRFIPRRYALSRASRFKAESKPERKTDPMVMEMPGYWRTHHYSSVLKKAFGLVSTRDKILSFKDSTSRQMCSHLSTERTLEWVVRPIYSNLQKLDWSCRPRTKPIGFIEAVHDLPNIKTYYHKIIDWSVAGQIAAIFSKKLVIWTPNTDVIIGLRAQYTTSIAFNPAGDQLAMAIFMMNRPWLDILDVGSNPIGHHGALKMLDPLEHPVSCLTWDGSGQYVVCGFGNGQISIVRVHPRCSKNVCDNKYFAHKASIIAIKFSCGSKYMATADELGQVYIWYWNGGHLTPITRWASAMCAFFDWHPWREDEIVIADSEPIMIALYHVPSRQVVSYYRRQDSDCIVTTLAFNKISGELVVCYSFTDVNKPPEILVLASMDRVVDVMRNHDDVIVHLLWSPDGKQLASVGYDETLTIWNFFGISPTNECKRKKLQRDAAASSSSSRTGGSVFGDGPESGRDASRIQCNRNKEATYRDLASSFLFKAMR
ncbi:protein cortex-like isoform X2 [Anopheles stephensi]|uniref:protein cortex-like isoform X2 n=2 Tax=Anopheles stephensi TaxID=30069 RepID=UPI0016588176|nr:protein cortex-like isoform X2 [Anopheles stephensi]XP_035899002.1 protein cortex-like isoform X2 [Anopheles stephensi]